MKKFLILALGFALFLCPLILFAQDSTSVGEVIQQPVGDPVNWIALVLSTALPLLSLFTKKFPNVLGSKLTTILGAVIVVGQAVYGYVNIDNLSTLNIAGMISAGLTALILFMAKDPAPPQEKV